MIGNEAVRLNWQFIARQASSAQEVKCAACSSADISTIYRKNPENLRAKLHGPSILRCISSIYVFLHEARLPSASERPNCKNGPTLTTFQCHFLGIRCRRSQAEVYVLGIKLVNFATEVGLLSNSLVSAGLYQASMSIWQYRWTIGNYLAT
jgi:hypothetical protein